MDYPRDLGQVDLWQQSLERSLARRGRPKRSSVELYRLRGERDLLLEDVLLESAQYSQLRRRAADHPLVPRPAAAVGGVSALTLLAVTTLPGLIGGGRSTKQRVTYAAKVRGRGRAAKDAASSALQPRTVAARALAGASTPVALHHRTAPNVVSVSESTRQLQRRLGVVADGDFGPITLRAVKGFQASHRLVVDGIVGPATRSALGLPAGPVLRANPIYFPKPVKPAHRVVHAAHKPRPAPKPMSMSATIRLMQQRLGIPADGQFGPATARALKAFQSRHGIVADGILGPATRAALGLPAGRVIRPDAALFPRPAAHHTAVHHPHHTAVHHHVTRPKPRAAPKAMSISATIRLMQQRLGIPADGQFGPVTVRALKAFQSRHGIVADGVIGPATRAALGLPAGPAIRPDAALFPRPAAHHTAVHHTTSSTSTPTSGPGPGAVAAMIAAANQIATRPYVFGGGHGSFNSSGYDCSGSVSFVLHAAGLLSSPEDSTALESYGAPGPGRFVTIYANAGHAWMTIDGRRFDTAAMGFTGGSRWSSTMASTAGYVVRHPAGL